MNMPEFNQEDIDVIGSTLFKQYLKEVEINHLAEISRRDPAGAYGADARAMILLMTGAITSFIDMHGVEIKAPKRVFQ